VTENEKPSSSTHATADTSSKLNEIKTLPVEAFE
jgi:hypothetical protein